MLKTTFFMFETAFSALSAVERHGPPLDKIRKLQYNESNEDTKKIRLSLS